MTAITITKETTERGKPTFKAKAGERESIGSTLGQALDALTASLGDDIDQAAVLIPSFQPDVYFTAQQQRRMSDLVKRQETLTSSERKELESLIDEELAATVARTESIVPLS